jgi:hypothetical protein
MRNFFLLTSIPLSEFGGLWYLSSFDKLVPLFQVIRQGRVTVFLSMKFGRFADSEGRVWFFVIGPNNITKNGGFLHSLCTKNIKSTKWIPTVQCTQKPHGVTLRNHTSRIPNRINSVPWMHAVTSTPYHDFTRSHQLRNHEWTRSHQLNSISWMKMVTPTPYHERMQFVDSVKSLSSV